VSVEADMGENETDTGQAAAEYTCISCGKDLGPGVALLYRGKPCPYCGQLWEGTAKAPIAGGGEPGGALTAPPPGPEACGGGERGG
jgi:hypothetical protein